jgi:hypothetical protein
MGNSVERDQTHIAPSLRAGSAQVHRFYSSRSWIEGEAEQQLETSLFCRV